jgi:hypothetical protein
MQVSRFTSLQSDGKFLTTILLTRLEFQWKLSVISIDIDLYLFLPDVFVHVVNVQRRCTTRKIGE